MHTTPRTRKNLYGILRVLKSNLMAALCCLVLTLGFLLIPTLAQRDRQAYCGACKAVVDELHYSVSKEDPHKTIETGSFRVNSKGQQVGVTSKRYAGSEAHLTELMEGVCDLMSNYGVSTDTKTGAKSYIRINSRAGESITLSNVNFSSDGSRDLKNACTSFVSEFEDDIISLFKGSKMSKDSLEKELCSKLCTKRTSEL